MQSQRKKLDGISVEEVKSFCNTLHQVGDLTKDVTFMIDYAKYLKDMRRLAYETAEEKGLPFKDGVIK